MAVKMRPRDIRPVKTKLAAEQGFRCMLCQCDLKEFPEKDWVLDHDHKTGLVRSVLCRNCNGMEGKVYNLANRAKRDKTPRAWLARLLKYWEYHDTDRHKLIHPTHKNETEKRIERNRKAREARIKKAAEKIVAKRKG